MRLPYLIPLTTVLLLGMLSACFTDDSAFVQRPGDDDNRATLRIIHAMPDAPPLHISVDDGAHEYELDYDSGSEPVQLEPGTVAVSVSRATAPDDILIEAELELSEGDLLNLVIFGSLNADDLQVIGLNEDPEPARAGYSRLHFLNAIHVDGDDWPIDLEANGEALVTDAAYGVWQAPTEVVADDGETYSLEARNQDGMIVTTTPTTLAPATRASYLVITAGIWGDGVADTDPEILLFIGLVD